VIPLLNIAFALVLVGFLAVEFIDWRRKRRGRGR
jgi:hypothetical protein